MYRLTYSGPPTSVALFILIAADSAVRTTFRTNTRMQLSKARIKAKEIVGESGYAVLRGTNKKICIIGFVDRTGSKLGVIVDLVTAASFEDAFSTVVPSPSWRN